jgi:WD40-like Beta Propeller Repeat
MANSMRKRRPALDFVWPVCWIVLALATTIRPSSRESVREELIRQQAQTGLTFAWVDTNTQNVSSMTGSAIVSGVRGIWFKKQAIISLEDSLEAFRPDGFSFGNIPRLAVDDMCWSHDQSKLAATLLDPPHGRLGIFDLPSKATQTVEPQVEMIPHVTSQCWSPDDKQIAYETEGRVKLYEVGKASIRVLAKGTDVTWSPDGNWIAFRDGTTYYAIRPDGQGRKKLFYCRGASSALYWAPDSRIVAYVKVLGFLQTGPGVEANQLRVRRLMDGSDDQLCPEDVWWYANYHWMTSSELMQRLEPKTRHSK